MYFICKCARSLIKLMVFYLINYLVERVLNFVTSGEYWLGADCVNVSGGSNRGSYIFFDQF